jgi:preprotein translocase subunit SecG
LFGFLLTLTLLDGLLLSVVVLLQAGKGDGLAAMGGGGGTMADGILGGRQAATLLTKTTWVTGGVFLGLLVVLSVMSSRARAPQPLLRGEFTTQAAPQPLLPPAGADSQASAVGNPVTGAVTPPPDTSR